MEFPSARLQFLTSASQNCGPLGMSTPLVASAYASSIIARTQLYTLVMSRLSDKISLLIDRVGGLGWTHATLGCDTKTQK